MAEKTAEEIRDEKCFPIVQTILSEMSTDLFKENGIKELALKILSLTLKEDLNVVTDMSYIPQLVLNALSGVNATVHVCDVVPLDSEKYDRVAEKILVILAKEKINVGYKKDEVEKNFSGIKDKISKLFLEEKINSLEAKHIMENILTNFGSLNNLLASSIEMSTEKATSKLFKIESTSDLTMKKLDEILKQ